MKKILLVSLLWLTSLPVWAQTDSSETDLQNLMDMKFNEDQVRAYVKQENLTVASTSSQAEEEIPSIVSVITRKDILLYGYRDLSEILRFVPGFEYGIDGIASAGQGFRGVWMYEGKGTILLNGLPVNDYFYGNTNIINQFPASMIERVEIIRGPGSVLYGGFSLVTVVNVITRSNTTPEGLRLTTNGLTLDGKAFGTTNNLSFNTKVGELQINGSAGYSLHPTSTRKYTDFWGNEVQFGNANTPRQSYYQTLQLEYKGLQIKYHHFKFAFTGQDGFDTVVARNSYGKNTEYFENYSDAVRIKYESDFSKKIKIEPQAEYSRGNPMFGATNSFSQLNGNLLGPAAINHHFRGQVIGTFKLAHHSELIAGGGYTHDIAQNRTASGAPAMYGSGGITDTSEYSRFTRSVFGFAQYKYQFNTNWQVFVADRFEHNTFGDATAPRVGLIFFQEPFNVKVLYSHAYRIPTPGQAYNSWIAYNDQLKPEESDNYEIEMGYRFTDNINLKTNLYYIDIKHSILWNGGEKSYVNAGEVKSMGVEGTLNVAYTKWGGFMNFSYNRPAKGSTDEYLTADKEYTLGLPPLKVNVGAHYRVGKVTFGLTGTYFSKRYGPSAEFAREALATHHYHNHQSTSYPQLFMANLSVGVKEIAKNLNMRLTGSNLFNAKYILIQPYYAGHAPSPANDRQITLQFTYEFIK
ncbi:Outer membrane receptor for ferrienterochelin and colicins [Flexibacter flexilis DSM 6793]|uniref:Outer membrane receptor for ferrienterochelin and colicins n=1 Tax=Flexibacter flexilis DSM 6793 TaxID=927664 RepID=A0A1I1D700_9BACT|nr:TonB-dependent receptor [Flexibacter flexilis]SFB70721.1 Outer membrane receptor for ferrienterochelin and colicins [Flexibacter flexilis DSM 6793]